MSIGRDLRGLVYAEFLISFLPFFLLFVGLVQVGLLAVARIVVHHAAVQAVRAAAVVIDDDPYFDESSETRRKHVSNAVHGAEAPGVKAARELVGRALPGFDHLRHPGCDRLERIRGAAYLPLSTLSPSYAQLASWFGDLLGAEDSKHGESVASALDDPWQRIMTGLAYDRVAAAVTFPEKPSASELRSLADIEFADDGVITVRVTYLYACNVPIARDLVCSTLLNMTGVPKALRKTLTAIKRPTLASVQAAYRAWSEEFPDEFAKFERSMGELAQAEAFVALLPLLMRPSERFVVLRAEASLPNQGAAYQYASELCKTKRKISTCEDAP
jgi:hypothetical protein